MMNPASTERKLPGSNHPAFYLGEIPVMGDLILAPMAGFCDASFRSLCRKFGSSLSYTAFINAMDVLYKWESTLEELHFLPQERPVIFQVFDNDPDRILQAALKLERLDPDAIDINMGCSTRRVSGRGAGAGLLLDPLKIGRIIRSLHQSLKIPVTAKIRLGWDHESRNHPDVARAAAENGAALIAVHGRTRDQAYAGQADWDAIAEIKQLVSIPVIGNGDVRSAADIERMKRLTGCDGVMIGRAAVGNPWIFQRRDREDIPRDEAAAVISTHLTAMIAQHGESRGIELFRKHLIQYLRTEEINRSQRQHLLTRSSVSELSSCLADLGYSISEH